MNNIPKSIPCVTSDIFNDSMSMAYVPQIQLIVDLKGLIDQKRMAKAVRLLMDKEPVLGCKFVVRFAWPYWKRISEDILDQYSTPLFVEVNNKNRSIETEKFLALVLNHKKEPQIKWALLRSKNSDRLIFKINHMAVDAAGAKETLYLVASIYNQLAVDENYYPEINLKSRSLKQVFRQFLPTHGYTFLLNYIADNLKNINKESSMSFPVKIDDSGDLRFVFKKIDKVKIQQFAKLSKTHGATLNDLFLTALIWGVAKETDYDSQEIIRIMGTVDLRRYLPQKSADVLANFSSFFFINLGKGMDPTFVDTLKRIKEEMETIKNNHIGLGWIFGSWILLKPYPFKIKKQLIQNIFKKITTPKNMGLSITNLGKIDSDKLKFNGVDIEYALVVPPGCIVPAFFMGMSGFNGTITLSMGFKDSSMDKSSVSTLFDSMVESIEEKN
jgi:NRPS condensation-like uncharacterized protein